MGLSHDAAATVGRGLGSVHAGAQKLAPSQLEITVAPTIEVRSAAFEPSGALPRSASVDGEGIAPPLAWTGVPRQAGSIAIVVEDPDAPYPEPYVHWLVYDLPPEAALADLGALAAAREGRNSTLKVGFTPAAPPVGHGMHHYHFQVFALERPLRLDAGAGRTALFAAMRGQVLAWGELVGTYERR